MGNKNIAKGNAQVGNQVGTVEGDFNSGIVDMGRRSDLSIQLADLQRVMAQARFSGTVDGATSEAFLSELKTAAGHLPIRSQESKNGFLLAMKRAKGLAEGLAEVTMKVTAAIAAARGVI